VTLHCLSVRRPYDGAATSTPWIMWCVVFFGSSLVGPWPSPVGMAVRPDRCRLKEPASREDVDFEHCVDLSLP
jgi:hypothetical protein